MNKLFLYFIIIFFSFKLNAIDIQLDSADIQIIELNNKLNNQLIEEDTTIKDEQLSDLTNNVEDNLDDSQVNDNIDEEMDVEISDNLISELPGIWENVNKEEILFLLNNISQIQSKTLKIELLNSLNINQSIPEEFKKENFNKLIIEALLMLGDRKKAYEIIQSLQIDTKSEHEGFYNKFSINYLLSSYKLREACSLRNSINNLKIEIDSNFYLKVDIFCLVLKEKFDEANLLNSLLIESREGDDYFQALFEKLQNPDLEINLDNKNINEQNIFLYSAMHRIGNLPLTPKFLAIDPMNLSIPIILSSSTNIDLRIKSAHFAFSNNLISDDSLAALYQTVDFSYDELNNSLDFVRTIENNIEISMSYFYQLINIQLLPTTRLNAIIKFLDFAKKNNLEKIAYSLSLKSLNTIEPSDEFAIYAPNIVKTYIHNKEFEKAEKWLLFSENLLTDNISVQNLNSAKLLLNLSNFDDEQNFTEILLNNLKKITRDYNEQDKLNKNELFYLIFSSLREIEKNEFKIFKKIIDDRPMPSLYLLNMMRDSLKSNSQIQLLLVVLVTMDGRKWNELHPEHFRLILLALKNYKQGLIYDDILLEILNDNKVI